MPSLEENLWRWNVDYDWPQQGDEWSEPWGGAEAQWYGTIFPRIHSFLPVETILEIAPGFGRWSSYLKDLCRSLVLVDLSERCIQGCRARFADERHIFYHVSDGRSLEMVEDDSVDFAFSFDSLVHAELDVIQAYIGQLARKLRPHAAAFIHHSNLASFLERVLSPEEKNWRADSVSARNFREHAESSGLTCLSQEIVNWGGDELTDVFSVVTPKDSRRSHRTRIVENRHFMDEAALIAAIAQLYSTEQTHAGEPPQPIPPATSDLTHARE